MSRPKFEAFPELSEDLQLALEEIKSICRTYGFDIDECAEDEYDCEKQFGEELLRITQLVTELDEITKA